MLPDINLLPKKPQRNSANLLSILLTLLGLMGGLAYIYYQASAIENEIADLTRIKTEIETEIARVEAELDVMRSTYSAREIQENIEVVLNQTLSTTQVMEAVKSHLPPGSAITTYAYEAGVTLTFGVAVDESRDVGSFVESLSTENWVRQARVESVRLDSGSRKLLGRAIIALEREALFTREEGEERP